MKNRRNIIESELPPQNPLDIWMKDGKFYRSTKKGWTLIEDQMEFTDSKLMYKSTATSGTIGVNKETGKASIYNDVTKEWSPLGGGLTETTWQELKNKRDAGKLTPGSLYRITDYQCTTTQENTQSAGHQFDIVLLALSENKLAEEGWAMMHENDTYFANSNLSAWKVWYCLDNDKSRFAWADDTYKLNPASIICDCYRAGNEKVDGPIDYSGKQFVNGTIYYRDEENDTTIPYMGNMPVYAWTSENNITIFTESVSPNSFSSTYTYNNRGDISYIRGDAGIIYKTTSYVEGLPNYDFPNGRGVIYRLIDEFNNDIKYDFKNIQFKRKLTDGQYDATNGTETWCYTLNIWYNDMCQDASIVGNTLPNDEGYVTGVYDNKFGYATAYDLMIEGVNTFAFALGDNVVLSFDDAGYYVGIKSNTIGNSFNSNTVGNGFSSNTIGNHFGGNIIGDDFTSNTIGNAFTINTIGNSFNTNTIGNYVSDNTIRDNFSGNTIGNNFNNKTISDNTVYKNYGNNGVELATKDDIGDIETALNNI